MHRMHRHLTAAHAALVAACDEADRSAGADQDSDTDRVLACVRDAISGRLEQIEAAERGRAFSPPRILGTLEEHLDEQTALTLCLEWQRDYGGVGPASLVRAIVIAPNGATDEVWAMVEARPAVRT